MDLSQLTHEEKNQLIKDFADSIKKANFRADYYRQAYQLTLDMYVKARAEEAKPEKGSWADILENFESNTVN